MIHRTPLAAAVVGALVIGGATTGTTLARWQDQAPLDAGMLESGDLEISVRQPGSTSVELGTLDLVAGGAAKALEARVVNLSEPGAPNLRYDVKYAGGSVPATLDAASLQIAVNAKETGDCSPAANGYTSLADASPVLNTTPIGYGDFAMCISLRAVAGGGSQGQVTLHFEAVQRP